MTGLAIAPGLNLPVDMVTETIGILANRGRGKTYAAHALVEEVHDAGVPVVILDVKGDWWGVQSSADGKAEGMPFYIFGGDHSDLPLEATAGELLADLVVDERVSVVLDLSLLSKTKSRSFATAFGERLYERNREPLFLVVDEADVLIPQRQSADTARLIGAYEDIAKRGRGRGIGMAVVTQRPQEVAKSVLDLMETLLLMGMTGRLALKAVGEWTNIHVDDDDPAAVIRELPRMQVGEAWVWSPLHGILQRASIRRLRTFDSHPTPKVGETRRTPKKRAALNLDALGDRIAATVERAKADDPVELHKRIRDLEAEVSRAQASGPLVQENELLSKYVRELETTIAAGPTGWGVLDDDQVSALTEASTLLASVITTFNTSTPPASWPALTLPTEEQSGSDPTAAERPVRFPATKPAPGSNRDGRERGRSDAAGSSTTRSPVGADEPPAGDRPQLKAGARRIVETLARQHPLRLTVAQLATLARFKRSGGTWKTYWSQIRQAGLVDELDGMVGLTVAGLAYAGVAVDREPLSADEVLERWRGVLKAGARRMLDELVDVHPERLTQDELAERLGMEVTGGTFKTYLSTLRTNHLVVWSGRDVCAAEVLFLGAVS